MIGKWMHVLHPCQLQVLCGYLEFWCSATLQKGGYEYEGVCKERGWQHTFLST